MFELNDTIRDIENNTATEIALSHQNIGDSGVERIALALRNNTRLATLHLWDNNIGADGVRALASSLEHNTSLTTLYLGDNNIGTDGARALASSLKYNTSLATLNLYNNNIGDDGVRALASSLEHNSTLTTLNLRYNNIGADGVRALVKAIEHNNTLTTLYLWNNNIGTDGARALAPSLEHNSTLVTLYLGSNNIGADGARALASAIKHNNTLITFNLWNNNIGADGMRALAPSLEHNSTLVTMNFRHNNIGADGMRALASSLEHNTSLVTLYLEGNNIGADGARALASSLEHNTSLITLYLENNNIDVKLLKVINRYLQRNINSKKIEAEELYKQALNIYNIRDEEKKDIREVAQEDLEKAEGLLKRAAKAAEALRSNSASANQNWVKDKLQNIYTKQEMALVELKRFDEALKVVGKRQTVLNDELNSKILLLYGLGTCYEDISKHLQEVYGVEVSVATISGVTDRIISQTAVWRSRPLESVYPVIFLDEIYFQVKQDGKVLTKVLYNVMGINQSGIKEILGFYACKSERTHFWLGVFNDLKARGVKDILIACVNGLQGFVDSIKIAFPNTEVQLCVIHQIRSSLKYVVSKNTKEFMADLKTVYQAETKDLAEHNLLILGKKWGDKYPMIIKFWQQNWDNLSTYFKYSKEIRRLLYTTNSIEDLHRQVRQYTKTKGVFTSENALFKLVFCAIKRISSKWDKPISNWALTISQLDIFFPDRLKFR